MIPELLNKQNRALELTSRKKLNPTESAELKELELWFEKSTKRAIRDQLAQCRRLEAHQKKTKGLNIGEYAVAA